MKEGIKLLAGGGALVFVDQMTKLWAVQMLKGEETLVSSLEYWNCCMWKIGAPHLVCCRTGSGYFC